MTINNYFITEQEILQDCINDVMLFNRLAGNDYLDPNVYNTYVKLLKEEFLGEDELVDSVKKDNPIGFLDGLCDCIVVASYLYACEYHKTYVNSINKAISYPDVEFAIKELTKYYTAKDIFNFLQGLENLTISLGGVQVLAAFREVNRSNLSKLPTIQQFTRKMMLTNDTIKCDELDKMINYQYQVFADNGRYEDITHQVITDENNEQRIVFKAGGEVGGVSYLKPKIIKPITFFEPELEQYLLDVK